MAREPSTLNEALAISSFHPSSARDLSVKRVKGVATSSHLKNTNPRQMDCIDVAELPSSCLWLNISNPVSSSSVLSTSSFATASEICS